MHPQNTFRRAVGVSIVVSLLAGCVHTEAPSALTVDRGYESVYLGLLKDARRCYPATSGAAEREVNGTLDGPSRGGKVTFSFRSTAGLETFMTAEIRGVEPNRTVVHIKVAPEWASHAKLLRGWISGTSSECP